MNLPTNRRVVPVPNGADTTLFSSRVADDTAFGMSPGKEPFRNVGRISHIITHFTRISDGLAAIEFEPLSTTDGRALKEITSQGVRVRFVPYVEGGILVTYDVTFPDLSEERAEKARYLLGKSDYDKLIGI